MTRAEFTQQMWHQSAATDLWYKKTHLSLEQATSCWWWNPPLADHWRLTNFGEYQLANLPDFAPHFQTWDLWCPHTSRINIMLGRLKTPWNMFLSADNLRIDHVCRLMLYGTEANMWMSLCGSDLERFLTTWLDRSL